MFTTLLFSACLFGLSFAFFNQDRQAKQLIEQNQQIDRQERTIEFLEQEIERLKLQNPQNAQNQPRRP